LQASIHKAGSFGFAFQFKPPATFLAQLPPLPGRSASKARSGSFSGGTGDEGVGGGVSDGSGVLEGLGICVGEEGLYFVQLLAIEDVKENGGGGEGSGAARRQEMLGILQDVLADVSLMKVRGGAACLGVYLGLCANFYRKHPREQNPYVTETYS
jgi:hypothetical protein